MFEVPLLTSFIVGIILLIMSVAGELILNASTKILYKIYEGIVFIVLLLIF